MNWLDRIEGGLVEVASKVGPILAPVPTAYLVGASSVRHLDWPWPIGVIAAVVIECLGVASTGLALTLWDYQKSKRKSDPSSPFWLSLVIVAAYFIVAVVLTVVLDIVPSLAVYAPALFPALSLAGVTILAIRIDHRERLAAIEQDRADKRADRDKRKAEKEQAVSERSVTDHEKNERPVTAPWSDRWDGMTAFVAEASDNPELVSDMTGARFAQLTGKPNSTARRWLRAARANGKEG